MVDVEVRAAAATDYAALAQIEEHGLWRSLPSESVFPDEMGEYTVAVVEGRVWGFCSGAHDSQAWAQCQMTGQPPADWTVSFVHNLAVHRQPSTTASPPPCCATSTAAPPKPGPPG